VTTENHRYQALGSDVKYFFVSCPAGREAIQGRDAGPPGRRVEGGRRRAAPGEIVGNVLKV